MKWLDVLHYTSKGNEVPPKRVSKSEEEWKEVLTPEEFQVCRKKGTERAFSGEYCEAHLPGIYACRCCGTVLFDSLTKFESKSGWPSFTQPLESNVIKYTNDKSFGMTRIEVECNVCDCHLGHVFPDGPPPTGLRFCINSVSIKLVN
jgi:peptide-methionine (R)-S-oxide reductase